MGGDIELLMRLDPSQTAKQLFNKLCERHPGKLDLGQYRSLQRRLSRWRKALTPKAFQMSLYADPKIQSHLVELIVAAVDRHLKLGSTGTNINEATSMS